MASTLILGCTGAVGSHILSTLRASSSSQISSIDVISRRQPKAAPDAKKPASEHINSDTGSWASIIKSISPPPSILFSGLATTRAQAGGFENQYKIDHDLNVELAKAAKESGTKIYVTITSVGADPKSSFAYQKMKGEIEEHVKAVGFEHTIILRPGLIHAARDNRPFYENLLQTFAGGLGKIHAPLLKDPWVQDDNVIARAAVAAGLMAQRGELKDKVWILNQKDIIRLGKTEWKGI